LTSGWKGRQYKKNMGVECSHTSKWRKEFLFCRDRPKNRKRVVTRSAGKPKDCARGNLKPPETASRKEIKSVGETCCKGQK